MYIDSIERLQRKFLRYLNFKHKICIKDYHQSCRHHHLLPLVERRQAADLTFLHNLLLGDLDCPSLLSDIKLVTPNRPVIRRNYLKLYTPTCSANYRKNSFFARTTNLFNTTYSMDVDLFVARHDFFKRLVAEKFFK